MIVSLGHGWQKGPDCCFVDFSRCAGFLVCVHFHVRVRSLPLFSLRYVLTSGQVAATYIRIGIRT